MANADRLASGEEIIYVALRLGDNAQRMATERLEAALMSGVSTGLSERGLTPARYPLFVPYRDCAQNELALDPDFYRLIFEGDMERLTRAFSIIGYLNDPSKDDGLCMELGYAFATRCPTLIFVTDFHQYRLHGRDDLSVLFDPILHRMIGRVEWHPGLPEARLRPAADVADQTRFIDEFRQRSERAEDSLLRLAESLVVDIIADPRPFVAEPVEPAPTTDLFVDFAGGDGEAAQAFYARIESELSNRGLTATFGRRFDRTALAPDATVSSLAERDIAACAGADTVLMYLHGWESDAGTSALIGMAKAMGKRILIYYPGAIELVAPRCTAPRNLMLTYSADAIARSPAELAVLLSSLEPGARRVA